MNRCISVDFLAALLFEDTTISVLQNYTLIDAQGLDTRIEIDRGVTYKNIKQLLDAGADVFVAGSHVFKSDDQAQTITHLKTLATG